LTKPALYLDMDGVLADFNLAAELVLNATPQENYEAAQRGRWPEAQWEKLREQPRFYRTLPKTDMADQLVDLARQYRDQLGWHIAMLTAIPKNNDVPEAFQDKVEWVQEYYPDVPIYFGPYSQDKAQHCHTARDILVDDRKDNCDQWRQAGGQAIRVYADNHREVVKELADRLEKLLHEQT